MYCMKYLRQYLSPERKYRVFIFTPKGSGNGGKKCTAKPIKITLANDPRAAKDACEKGRGGEGCLLLATHSGTLEEICAIIVDHKKNSVFPEDFRVEDGVCIIT